MTVPQYFGYASPTGSFHYWRDIATVDFGKGLQIPLRFDFDSQREETSPYFGTGWRCLLLEAGVVQKSPDILEVTLLGGQKIYLLQDKKAPSKYQSQDSHWRAERKSDQLEVVRDCGWAMKFQLARSSRIDGQIISLTTDKNRTLTWERKGNVVTGIQEAGQKPVLEVKFNASGKTAEALVINGWKYALNFSDIESDPAEKILQSVTWPNNPKETYALKLTGPGPSKLSILTSEKEERVFTWNAETGQILSDSDGWSYRVGEVIGDWEYPHISRVNSDGKMESYRENTRSGVIVYQSPDGISTRRYFVTRPGSNFWRLQKIERTENGKTSVTLDTVFDQEGRVVEKYVDGSRTTIAYLLDGRREQRTVTPNGDEVVAVFGLSGELQEFVKK